MKNSGIKDDLTAWMNNAGRFPLLSPEETSRLAARIQALKAGDPKRGKLVNKLVEHNLRLVIYSVRGYLAGGTAGRKWGCPETVDFLQVGVIGLIRAAELYDPAKGYAFTTYANHWIRSKVSRHAIKTRAIVHVSESMSRNIISYKKNGFLRSRRTGEVIPDEKILPILQEAEAALTASSLEDMISRGCDLTADFEGSCRDIEERDLAADLDAALDEAGVSAIGKEVLMMLHGHGFSRAKVEETLGLTPSRLRTQREIALRQARENPRLAELLQ
jgi:RNA polymerase nonessential primary-like sigma factor